jgi:hypothetical protein
MKSSSLQSALTHYDANRAAHVESLKALARIQFAGPIASSSSKVANW